MSSRPVALAAAALRSVCERSQTLPDYAGSVSGEDFLHDYQKEAVRWLMGRLYSKPVVNCILGDEMGLGKTLVALSCISTSLESGNSKLPSLVICPLSVTSQWDEQCARFFPHLRVLNYAGSKEVREGIQKELESTGTSSAIRSSTALPASAETSSNQPVPTRKTICPFDICVASYETIMTDVEFLERVAWNFLIVDEAHRLKNAQSKLTLILLGKDAPNVKQAATLLKRSTQQTTPDDEPTLQYKSQSEFSFKRKLLLTGTPVHNNLSELEALIMFLFPYLATMIVKGSETQTEYSGTVSGNTNPGKGVFGDVDGRLVASCLILRRLASEVSLKLPSRTEVTLHIPMTTLQRDVYKYLLTGGVSISRLFTDLRKCANHPYLIEGVEPEPFEEGEHLVRNSGKLVVLDGLIEHIQNQKSVGILMFSTSTQFLDIVQDFLALRNFQCQRLDGSVRGDDRNSQVKEFQKRAKQDTHQQAAHQQHTPRVPIFLLSTRAGGVGLNLASADTVIFLDSDPNPQMDKQAACRAHRQGQSRPVTIYRLVTQNTVDELIFNRGKSKLQFAANIFGEDISTDEKSLAFGLEKLFPNGVETIADESARNFSIPVGSFDVVKPLFDFPSVMKEAQVDSDQPGNSNSQDPGNYKTFEGVSYEPSKSALDVLDELKAQKLRAHSTTDLGIRKRTTIIDRETISRLIAEQRERKRQIAAEVGFVSHRLQDQSDSNDHECNLKPGNLYHVRGDVTEPIISGSPTADEHAENDAETDKPLSNGPAMNIDLPESSTTDRADEMSRNFHYIFVPVTDKGSFPDGRFYDTLKLKFPGLAKYLREAKKAGDCAGGMVHAFPVEKLPGISMFVALTGVLTGDEEIEFEFLKNSLRILAQAKSTNKNLTIHFPRIGDGSGNFYSVERLIKRYICNAGCDAVVYYFSRSRPTRPPVDRNQDRQPSQTLKQPTHISQRSVQNLEISSLIHRFFHDQDIKPLLSDEALSTLTTRGFHI